MKNALLTTLLLLASFKAFAGDKLAGVHISTCSEKVCMRIDAKQGYRSQFDTAVTNFLSGQIKIHQKLADGSIQESATDLVFTDGYIDNSTMSVVLRGLKDSEHQDALVHLSTGEVQYF